MTDLAAMAADARWIPHRYDRQTGRVQFLRLDAPAMRKLTFLADAEPADSAAQAWVPARDLAALRPQAGRLHFVFHTAFCRSTLLARALDLPGVSFGLSEPAILNDLAMGGREAGSLVAPVLALLARPVAGAPVTVVKPSNVANALLPAVLQLRADARVLLLSGTLSAFLRSVHKKGLMGRRWARRLHAHVMTYAPVDLGMAEGELFELTDLQVAGLAWFLQQRHFALVMRAQSGDRLRTLDADALVADRARTLGAVASHFGLGASPGAITAVANGPVFQRHAKLGTDFAATMAEEDVAAHSSVVDEEVAMVATWIDAIIANTGLILPARRAL